MRLFIGIPLGPAVINQLEHLTRCLQSDGDGLRWASADSWHITLQFLGETSLETYRCVAGKLRDVTFPPFSIALNGLGFFDRAGVFFADVEISPRLGELQKRALAATSQCGFVTENRPFHPHITLARSKGNDRTQALRKLKRSFTQTPKFPSFVADHFLLYEAFLGPGGSRYEIRDQFRATLP
jgi:2'-5' RNA ligase